MMGADLCYIVPIEPSKQASRKWAIYSDNNKHYRLGRFKNYYVLNTASGECRLCNSKYVKALYNAGQLQFGNIHSKNTFSVPVLPSLRDSQICVQFQDELILILKGNIVAVWYDGYGVVVENPVLNFTRKAVVVQSLSPLRVSFLYEDLMQPSEMSFGDCIAKVCMLML